MDQAAEKIIVEVASKGLSSLLSETTKKVVEMVRRPKPAPAQARDRRTHERRKGPVDMRLRVGIWFEFHRKTRLGETETVDYIGSRLRDKLIEASIIEADRYQLNDLNGAPVTAATAVNMAVELACNDWKNLPPGEQHAGTLTELVARRLLANFRVKQHDRRDAEHRTLAAG